MHIDSIEHKQKKVGTPWTIELQRRWELEQKKLLDTHAARRRHQVCRISLYLDLETSRPKSSFYLASSTISNTIF